MPVAISARIMRLWATSAATSSIVLSVMLGAAAQAVGWSAVAPVAAAGVLIGVFVTALSRRAGSSHSPADVVTLVRATLASGCAAWVALAALGSWPAQSWGVFALAAGAWLLDGVDGAVARHTGSASAFGARLDAETDAALILVLSASAVLVVGWWVLVAGLLRYVFVLGQLLRPRWQVTLPYSRARRCVAAVVGGGLVAITAPPVGQALAVGTALGVVGLLLWSFARDVVALERGRVAGGVVGDVVGGPALQGGVDPSDVLAEDAQAQQL